MIPCGEPNLFLLRMCTQVYNEKATIPYNLLHRAMIRTSRRNKCQNCQPISMAIQSIAHTHSLDDRRCRQSSYSRGGAYNTWSEWSGTVDPWPDATRPLRAVTRFRRETYEAATADSMVTGRRTTVSTSNAPHLAVWI